jgi:hypothetical protein
LLHNIFVFEKTILPIPSAQAELPMLSLRAMASVLSAIELILLLFLFRIVPIFLELNIQVFKKKNQQLRKAKPYP